MLIYLVKMAWSGRFYYRHPSNMGSVMMYYDDPNLSYRRKVLVLDAKYRSNQRFGAFGIRSENKLLNYWCDFDEDDIFIIDNISDRNLINNYPRDPQSSKVNCDNWMKLNSRKDEYSDRCSYIGVPAVSYCRNIFVDEAPCELPNINILMRIYVDRETIDDLDPTILDYSKYALSAKYNQQGDWTIGEEGSSGNSRSVFNNNVWSSTETDSWGCLTADCDGFVFSGNKLGEFSVIPVLEL